MVSTLHMGLISCRDWLCELCFIQARVLCENDKTFCLAEVFRRVFIPIVRIENPGFLLATQW